MHQSDSFVRLASDIGEHFDTHDSVLECYLLPSLRACSDNWAPLKGAKNDRGDNFDYELGYVILKQVPDARVELPESLEVHAINEVSYEKNRHSVSRYITPKRKRQMF